MAAIRLCPGGGTARDFGLERKFQSKLSAWSAAHDPAEVGTVRNVAVRIVELSVVEQVEEFGPEFEVLVFLIGVIFWTEKSKLLIPGPQQMVRFESAKQLTRGRRISLFRQGKRIGIQSVAVVAYLDPTCGTAQSDLVSGQFEVGAVFQFRGRCSIGCGSGTGLKAGDA